MVVIPPNVASRHLLTPARPSSSSQEAISNAMHKTPKPGTAPRALAGAQPPAQTPSPAPFIGLSPPTSPRRAKNNQTANPTSPTRRHRRVDSLGGASGDDDGRTPSGAIATHKPRRGVAASLDDLVHWRRPARTAKVAGGGFYLMLCVGSLRQMPLPAGTVACYAFIFALAASLFTRLFQRVRRNLGFGLGIGGMDAAAMESSSDATRKKREARVRLLAAKFGGWVAASAAARAPTAAGDVIAGGYRAMGPPCDHAQGLFPAVVRVRGGGGVVLGLGTPSRSSGARCLPSRRSSRRSVPPRGTSR